jgi:putative DNA methylase
MSQKPDPVQCRAYDGRVRGTPVAESWARTASARIQSPLRHIDPERVAQGVRTETRNREVHLPPVSVYRWWARRTESVNGAVLDAFAQDHQNARLLVADPLAGGGVIPWPL